MFILPYAGSIGEAMLISLHYLLDQLADFFVYQLFRRSLSVGG
jgi:hypothetical protein